MNAGEQTEVHAAVLGHLRLGKGPPAAGARRDVNIKQVEGRSPIYQAASLGNGNAVLGLLLASGADPNIAMANGRTPLMAASRRGDVEAMHLLIDAKAEVDTKNGRGETALMLAAGSGNPEACGSCSSAVPTRVCGPSRDETALGNAGTAGNADVVRMLLDHGAEINVRNSRGYSPLMLAASSDVIPADVVKQLLANGADRSFVGDYDETALDMAAKRGDTGVTRLLGGWTAKPPAAATTGSHASAARSVRTLCQQRWG